MAPVQSIGSGSATSRHNVEPRSRSLSSRATNQEHNPHMKMSHLTPSGSSQFWVGFSCATFEEEKRVLHNPVMFWYGYAGVVFNIC